MLMMERMVMMDRKKLIQIPTQSNIIFIFSICWSSIIGLLNYSIVEITLLTKRCIYYRLKSPKKREEKKSLFAYRLTIYKWNETWIIIRTTKLIIMYNFSHLPLYFRVGWRGNNLCFAIAFYSLRNFCALLIAIYSKSYEN